MSQVTPGRRGAAGTPPGRRGSHPARSGSRVFGLVLFVVEPGQPAGQPVHGDVEARVEVDEVTQPRGQPGQRDLLVAAPFLEFLDTAVREVHQYIKPPRGSPSRCSPGGCWRAWPPNRPLARNS